MIKKTKKESKKSKEDKYASLKEAIKYRIIRPHFDDKVKKDGKWYYRSEMTTGAGTHGGPLVPVELLEKKTKKKVK